MNNKNIKTQLPFEHRIPEYSEDLKSDHSKSGLIEGRIPNVQWGSEIWPFEIRTFWRSDYFKWSGFQMVGLLLWLYCLHGLPQKMTVRAWKATIQIPNFLKSGFGMVRYLKVGTIDYRLATAMVPTNFNLNHSKSQYFWTRWQPFYQKPFLIQVTGGLFVPNYLKWESFEIGTLFYHC